MPDALLCLQLEERTASTPEETLLTPKTSRRMIEPVQQVITSCWSDQPLGAPGAETVLTKVK